jgi:hypothetical protein
MTTPLEAAALEKVAERYRARGYAVEIHPSLGTLPAFLEGHQPDLIARGPRESVVVELKVGTQTSVADRLRDLAERVSREKGWRLSLVFVDPKTADLSEREAPSLGLVEGRLRNANQLAREGQIEAAFLLLWSALEGLLRARGQQAGLPLENLPPSALIRELYSAGELSREHFDLLLRLLPARNELVHGFGSTNGVDFDSLRAVTEMLLAEATTQSA